MNILFTKKMSIPYLIKLYFIKTLRRINLLNKFNFYFLKKLNCGKVKILFINGIGLSNFILEDSWIDSIIVRLLEGKRGVFIDIGANIGQTLLSLKTQMPDMEYIGFEPNSICVHYINELVKVNKFKKCKVYNIALSSEIRKLELEKIYVDDPKASVISELRPGLFDCKDFVFGVDYDTYFDDLQPVFIKIDVEGAELDVLEGMKRSLKKYNPIIVCEILDSHSKLAHKFTQERAASLYKLLNLINYFVLRLKVNPQNNKLSGFEKLDAISINQWTSNSFFANEYLFYPSGMEPKVLDVLNSIAEEYN